MATNPDRPRGFTPANRDGSSYNGNVRVFNVDSNNGTAIFVGDPVKMEADGNVTPAGTNGDILGICTGVKIDLGVAATEHPGYLPASTAGEVFVHVAGPEDLFVIQEDSTGSNLAKADIGQTVPLVAGSGNTNTGRSAFELDSSAHGTGTDHSVVLIALVNDPDNTTGTNADWLVQVNRPQFKGAPLSSGI